MSDAALLSIDGPIATITLNRPDAFNSVNLAIAQKLEQLAAEVERALAGLAQCAAERGMSEAHWTFVVDGLIAHAKRRCPQNEQLPSYIARGFDFSARWPAFSTGLSASNSSLFSTPSASVAEAAVVTW